MVLSGTRIANLIRSGKLLIGGFAERITKDGYGHRVLSYGTGFAGYDIRLGTTFLIPRGPKLSAFRFVDKTEPIFRPVVYDDDATSLDNYDVGGVLDPKHLYDDPSGCKDWVLLETDVPFVLPDGVFVLGESSETFEMPPDRVGICFGKSTYARCGVLVNVTPLEPGWKGRLVIEVANVGHSPVVIYPGEGIAQVLFLQVDGDVSSVYSGKWQDQKGLGEVYRKARGVKE
jgi:deoxycytidine triphosphate deaminase